MAQIFLDTAKLDEIREAASWGVLDGVTTNPTLMMRAAMSSGRDFCIRSFMIALSPIGVICGSFSVGIGFPLFDVLNSDQLAACLGDASLWSQVLYLVPDRHAIDVGGAGHRTRRNARG